MDTAAIDQAIVFASATLLVVLAGLTKGQFEWRPRPPSWLRWRR